jgi:N-hydroxyarylamine O-acetyltransferase
VLEKKNQEGYYPLYAFTLEECSPDDFLMSNHFTSTFPGSFFLTMRMCTMPQKDGRITLTDSHFKVVKENDVVTSPITSEGQFKILVKEKFNLDLDLLGLGK